MRWAAFVGVVLVVVLGLWLRSGRDEPRVAIAVCDGVVGDVEAVVRGELRLHRGLLPDDGPTAAMLEEAVALQLRYAFAAGHNVEDRLVLTPDGPPRAIEMLSGEEVAYGRDVRLDWPEDPELRPESAYVRRALARGRLSATDPALVFRWQARVRFASCDPDGRGVADLQMPAPYDPYLLYWTVGSEVRVEHVYRERRAISYPCADRRIADYAHPEYLWYYWQPRRGDCVHAPDAVGEVALQVVSRRAPGGELTAWRDDLVNALADRPLRVVVVFGYLNHQVDRPDPAVVRAALMNDEAVDLEWGSEQFVAFVRATDGLLDGRTLVASVGDAGPVAAVSGALRGSGRRVEIVATLTETDVLVPAPHVPRHTPLLLAGLREADAILYAGHSGLGINFSRARLELDAPGELAAALAGSPTRLIAFIGCYTYAYFGDDLAGALPQDALFVYTGNSVAQVADSTLHVLKTVDCLLGSGATSACEVPPPGPAEARDFVIYELAR